MKIFKIVVGVLFFTSMVKGFIRDSVGIPMRDGVHLGTDLYFPVTSLPPWPTLLQRTLMRESGTVYTYFL